MSKHNGVSPWAPKWLAPIPPAVWWETLETAAWRLRLVPWIEEQRRVTVDEIVRLRRAS